MSEEIIDSGANTPSGERPTFLTVLCILSFIAAGFAAIGAILLATAAAVVVTSGADVTSTGGVGFMYVIIVIALAAVSLVGVIKMWKLQKQGFTIYAAAGVASIVVGAIFVGFDIVGLIITGAFIAMYYVNLKHMH